VISELDTKPLHAQSKFQEDFVPHTCRVWLKKQVSAE